MNEPLIFYLAKLLSTIEYNEFGPCYTLDGTYYTSSNLLNESITGEEKPEYIAAPTIASVIMWLYKNHNLWISVKISIGDKWHFELYDLTNKHNVEISIDNCDTIDFHNSPTEAYEKAIRYCLLNLVQKFKIIKH